MSVCKGCGKEIIWGETQEGKKMPLDPAVPVYYYNIDGTGKITKTPRSQFMISHFVTCPEANKFSGKNKTA